jgi:hypothetical protein
MKKILSSFVTGVLLLSVTLSLSLYSSEKVESESTDTAMTLKIPPLRERVLRMEEARRWKRKHVLPMVMREQGIDLWIIRDNEADKYHNNEGPIYSSLLLADHRGMIYNSQYRRSKPAFLLFHDTEDDIEYLEPRDYEHITKLVKELNPKRIAISRFNNKRMLAALGKKYAALTVDSWMVGVRWYETISPGMIDTYRLVERIAHAIISEGFSNRAVVPNVTTIDDLNWWFRHRMLEFGLEHENHPSISIQRSEKDIAKYDDPPEHVTSARTRNDLFCVIRRGDILRIDTDLYLFGLESDSHRYAYILRSGESDVPKELKDALDLANRIEDQFRQEFKAGRTGKEIVAASKKLKFPDNIVGATNDFHPPPKYIQRFVHNGLMLSTKSSVVGMTSGPGYVSTSIVTNDHVLHDNTLYAFEPHIDVFIPGWGDQGIELGMGGVAVFTEGELQYLDRSVREEWLVIR